MWKCQKDCDAFHYLSDNIFITFSSKLYRQIVGIPMGTKCALLVADLFLCLFLFDLILYVPSTIFQLCRDGSSWVKPVLS